MITSSAQTEVTQSGTMDTSKSRRLTVNTQEISAIVATLTNQYSDPAMAAVREYACNARDSHVEAGKRHVPIEVTLPNNIISQLSIQDYGIGLSCEGILETFAVYGTSTKRKSNEYIGAMGIGSKAGFTVGNQFLVTGVKDGKKTVALFVLDESGEPSVDILDQSFTDEPNGVLIEIGVEDIQAIRNAAQRLFYTWQQGTVLVDGQTPQHVWGATNSLGDNLYLATTDHTLSYGESLVTIVMGGVSYKLNDAMKAKLSQEQRNWLGSFQGSKVMFYANTPIGSVDITPSREDLRVTRHTTETVSNIIAQLMVNLPKWISSEVKGATTYTEAAMFLRKLNNTLVWHKYDKVKWRGKDFKPEKITLEHPHFYRTKGGRGNSTKIVTRRNESTTVHLADDLEKITVVTGVPDGKDTIVRRYLKAIMDNREDKGTGRTIIASPLTEESVAWFAYGKGQVIDTVPFVEWWEEGRKLLKIARASSTPRAETAYEVLGESDKLTATEINELDEPIAVYLYKENRRYGSSIAGEALGEFMVVQLGKGQQLETFLRRVPGARLAKSVISSYASGIMKKMKASDKLLLSNNSYVANMMPGQVSFLINNKDRITNKKVLEYIAYHEAAIAEINGERSRLALLNAAHQLTSVGLDVSVPPAARFMQNYLPMVALYSQQSYSAHNINSSRKIWVDQLVQYINDADIDFKF